MHGTDAPSLLEDVCLRAERAGASDVHLHADDGRIRVAFRLDGLLVPVMEVDRATGDRLVGRIKYLARLKTYQHSVPQDGRIDRADIGTGADLRVSTYPTVQGENVVLRLFGSAPIMAMEDLGYPRGVQETLDAALAGTAGLVLFTGPAGSGKTTAIYACLRRLAMCTGQHVITVEDPVEQMIAGIMQTEINEPRGLTFARACRHLLRQDPQVLVIGEIRDDETAVLAVRAALTGHRVISTLHAGSCQGVTERLLAMCGDRHAVASVLSLIMNQRLARCLCEACAGRRCGACMETGYRGRIPVTECVAFDDALREQFRRSGPGVVQPNPTLDASGRALIETGRTDAVELRRVLGE